jgi:hypothetical protein
MGDDSFSGKCCERSKAWLENRIVPRLLPLF